MDEQVHVIGSRRRHQFRCTERTAVTSAAAPTDLKPSSPGALDGVLVADFSRVLAGPLATMMLADLGATVIKVERPDTGDDTRAWGPPWIGEMSTYYVGVNRNKRSVTLDLTDPADLALARTLALRADVLIENFLPGRLCRFGLDAATLLAENPALIYCSISGFGSGPGADLPGYDFLVQAVGGLMSITGQPGAPPTKAGVALVDVLTGLHATVTVLAALRARDHTGNGQHVEVDLFSGLLAALVNQASAFLNTGTAPTAMGNQHPSIAPYETLAAKDAPLAVAVGNDRQFRLLVTTLGRPELAADARFASNRCRVAHRGALIDALETALADSTAAVWAQRLQAVGIPCGPVNDLAGAFELARHIMATPVVTFPDAEGTQPDILTVASPLHLAATPVRYHRAPPRLGADSTEVKRWLAADRPPPLAP
jgi:crotonobetainyl-CoA:carnitine CoA-transferase CaiB-like acyl-CoA transferase